MSVMKESQPFRCFRILSAATVLAAILFLVAGRGASSERGASLVPLPALEAPNPAQVELGKMLFFDPRLSGDAGISCATCHDPQKGWGDGQALSTGYPGSLYFRNAQTLLNVAYSKSLYWDGRLGTGDMPSQVRDSLTEAHFMNIDGRLLQERLKQVPEYVKRFPEAMGGEPSFGRILNAIAAFEKTLVSRNVPLDRYLKGDQGALSEEARKGLELFQGKAGCVRCHHGPLLSDGGFHNLGVPENPAVLQEPMRHIVYRRFLKTLGVPNYHNLRRDVGLYAVTKKEADLGKFKTPTLREVSRTAPYMHNGVLATLEEVIEFYDRGAGQAPSKSPLLKPLGLSEMEKKALLEFLKSLSGDELVVAKPELQDYQLTTLGKN